MKYLNYQNECCPQCSMMMIMMMTTNFVSLLLLAFCFISVCSFIVRNIAFITCRIVYECEIDMYACLTSVSARACVCVLCVCVRACLCMCVCL